MDFECENCHFRLRNEFCPKCGQRMNVGCDVCPSKDEHIEDLNRQIEEHLEDRLDIIAKRDEQMASQKAHYDAVVERQRVDLEETSQLCRQLSNEMAVLKGERVRLGETRDQMDSAAWQKIAAALEIDMPIGYVINEASVLRQLKIERSAAALLRAKLYRLESEAKAQVDEFAKAREEFLAKLNGQAQAQIAAPADTI